MLTLKPTVLALTLALGALSAGPASAATFMYRHYVLGMTASPTSQAQQAASSIVVALAGTTLPVGKVSVPYSYDLSPLLSVTGDSTAFDPAGVSWQLVSGTLPSGLSLGSSGVLSGTPASYSPGSNFQVQATYKNKAGQQVYTIVVNDVVLHATQVSSGGNYTCAVTTEGRAKCWGNNDNGQLGNNSTVSSLVPVDVVGAASGVASILAGPAHACLVTTAGGVKCWGANTSGQLGNGSVTNSSVPVDVSGLASGVAAVSVGGSATCAVTTAGGVKCWGDNAYGQLGNNSTTSSSVPVDVYGLGSGTALITLGTYHACAVTTSGGAKCWGYNTQGQLGNNSTTGSGVPVDVMNLNSGVARISSGSNHVCVVTTSGGAKCWGWNNKGQVGNTGGNSILAPVDVVGLASGVANIAGGERHTCAVTSSGSAKCWGLNSYGQLGNNSTTNTYLPVDVVGLASGVTYISGGSIHTCALAASGVTCWGANTYGQLGNNSTTSSAVPVEVVAP